MKHIIFLLLILSFILGLQNIPLQQQDSVMADTTYQNPNGSSELAKLMRDMQEYTNKARADIDAGNPAAAFPADFIRLYTAKISETMEKSEYYGAFADLYIMSVKNYAGSAPAQRVETYNNMVSACLACHSQHCPGPVKVIKKMFIP